MRPDSWLTVSGLILGLESVQAGGKIFHTKLAGSGLLLTRTRVAGPSPLVLSPLVVVKVYLYIAHFTDRCHKVLHKRDNKK